MQFNIIDTDKIIQVSRLFENELSHVDFTEVSAEV